MLAIFSGLSQTRCEFVKLALKPLHNKDNSMDMCLFSGRHFPAEVILWVVRWYLRYPLSYRNVEEML
jgi:hypothetical protein